MIMALSTSRPFLADVGCGEQELDANSALMELDKGLRSGKLGEQCEAVVRFPRLFQRYPFPILINSAFLKLADVFRVGNNFLRLCVLKVTQQSEKHLEKILNVDEFVKRIFSVIHSNDPIARAITLRMLGSLASIIPERKNAHHSIRQSLDSHNNFEVEAAIFAAANFSAQSKDFAAGICNKVSEMIRGKGNHDIAVELYQSMLTQVASEHFYFWLNSLKEFSQAERCFAGLQDDDYSPALSCIEESLKSYHKGIASLTAASTPLNPLSFQCDFVKLRIDTLQAFSQLICTCNSLKTSPPPAIATAIALTSGNDLQRCGRISVQMKQSMEEFQSLATRYGELYQSSFDADSATLRNMELQQQSCLLISYAIEALILDPESVSFQESGFSGGAQAESEYERRMMSVFNRVFEETESLGRKYPPVSYLHTACLCNAVIALLKVPFSFQRYFFQKLQSTSIKLALSPSPRSPTEPIMVQNNQQMALKVEGVVQHGSKPGLFRRIQAVCLHVSSTLQNKTGQDYKIPLENLTNEMEQRVQPHNDYFSTQFLLNFAVLGNHSITVEASVADSNGIIWKTGPKTTIAAKSLEDPYSQQLRLQQQQQQQQPSSSSSQQQQQRTVYSRF
nr:PREDICTED: integrator complex subunit 7 [Latimeria chalumnae]|eukprot:XP_014347762.1 PREDICTED: integrator complex subunit 7 [Latimeria chalumnae]